MSRFVKTNNGYGGSEIRTDGLFEGVSVRFLYPLGKLRVRHNGTKELHVVSPKSETGVKYRVMIRIEEGGGKIGKDQQQRQEDGTDDAQGQEVRKVKEDL